MAVDLDDDGDHVNGHHDDDDDGGVHNSFFDSVVNVGETGNGDDE